MNHKYDIWVYTPDAASGGVPPRSEPAASLPVALDSGVMRLEHADGSIHFLAPGHWATIRCQAVEDPYAPDKDHPLGKGGPGQPYGS